MRRVAVAFTNFGPYHLARLRALGEALHAEGGELIAYEMAAREETYSWHVARDAEPFEWITLFPERVLEHIPAWECKSAMTEALERDQPDAVGIVGYARPESMAMLDWAEANGAVSVLMSESQAIDHPRVWWKEAVKRRRVRRFSAGLVGGPRHRDYLVSLGMSPDRIALGYNAVDGDAYARDAERARRSPNMRIGLPEAPYFLAVSRFVPEKNLVNLVRAYVRYRGDCGPTDGWDLVLCGGGPDAASIENVIASSKFRASIHTLGFLQVDELPRWYAFSSCFVHPSLMEPWGLVVNEAAACGLPLLVSDRAGCVDTFVPEGSPITGRRLDGNDVASMAEALAWMAGLPEGERAKLGKNAAAIARKWGPERFATGTLQALELADRGEVSRRPSRLSRLGV